MGEGQVLKNMLPFGTQWPMNASLPIRRNHREREVFRSWVAGLEIPGSQGQRLAELLELMDELDFVEGRAACVSYEAELGRRTGLSDSLQDILKDLKDAGLLTSHFAGQVFEDGCPGVVLRIRRPGVVLSVEAAGPLWHKDSWVHQKAGGHP